MTQQTLAEKSRVPLWTLRGYEQDHRGPTWKRLLDLCKALAADPRVFEECDPEAEPGENKRGRPTTRRY